MGDEMGVPMHMYLPPWAHDTEDIDASMHAGHSALERNWCLPNAIKSPGFCHMIDKIEKHLDKQIGEYESWMSGHKLLTRFLSRPDLMKHSE